MRIFILILLFLGHQFGMLGQEKKTISYFKYLEFKDGLPSSNVQGFLTDSQNGYWFRTANSISYYNGHEFLNYAQNNAIFGISNTGIQDFRMWKNHLYVFGNAGIDEINCRTKKSRSIYKSDVGIDIKSGFVTRSGKILVVGADGIIYVFMESHLKVLGKIEFVTMCTITETKDGLILISNNHRQMVVLSPVLEVIQKIELEKYQIFNEGPYTFDQLGTLVFVKKKAHRYHVQKKRLEPISFPYTSTRLFFATDDYYYFVANYKQVTQVDRKTGQKVALRIFLNQNYFINQLDIDQSGTLVLCTNQGIILYQEPSSGIFQLPDEDRGKMMGNTARRALIETRDHKIVQVHYHGVNIYDPIRKKNKVVSKESLFGYAAVMVGNTLWIGSDGMGLFKMNLSTGIALPTSFHKELKEGKAMHVTALTRLSDTMLLLGSSFSSVTLKTYNIQKDKFADVVIFGLPSGKLSAKVNAIVEDGFNNKWICNTDGLLQLTGDLALKSSLSSSELGTTSVNHVYLAEKNIIWMATDNGIIQYDLKSRRILQKLAVDDGLAGNKCISILPDQFNTLWVSTYAGLSRIDLNTNAITNYYTKDGLPDDEYNYSSYLRAENGDVYFGGLNGYIGIRPFPNATAVNRLSQIGVDYVLMNKKEGAALLDLNGGTVPQIHKDDDRLSVVFSANNHLNAQYLRYYYKVKGLHSDWIAMGRQNKVELSFLPAGRHTLLVQTEGGQNRSRVQAIEMPFVVYSYWYESKFFYIATASLIIFLAISFFYLRYNAVIKISKLKTDLANDIHDEIGSMLTKSIMQMELIRMKAGNQYPEIKKIEVALRDTVQRFRNVLWSLNSDNQKTEDFVGKVNSMLEEIFEQTRFTFVVTNLSPNAYFNRSIRVKRNMLLIIKELATNALKHSNGSLFELIIRSKDKGWDIRIVDNGINDSSLIQMQGLGLLSIEKRVESMKGLLFIEKKEKGFFVHIKL